MSKDDPLSQIRAAFAPYAKPQQELRSIRAHIAEHLESLQPSETVGAGDKKSAVVPGHVTGVRRRYLKALQANVEAKREYARLYAEEEENRRTRLSQAVQSKNDFLIHLEVLKLRRRHRQYQTLSRCTSQLEALAEQNGIFDSQPATEPLLVGGHDYSRSVDTALVAEAQELTRRLELALLQANHQLKREQQLLDDIKTRRETIEEPAAEAKSHALAVTRAELTAWVEESLAKCDINDDNLATTPGNGMRHTPDIVDHDQTITDGYQKYLEARTRLLAATSALSSPLAHSNDSTTLTDSQPLKPSNTPARQPPLTPRPASKPTEPSALPLLTAQHLPLSIQHNDLSQLQSHITTLLSTHDIDLTSQLHRLSDESHLLPSYPILANSKPKLKPDHRPQHSRSKSSSQATDSAGDTTHHADETERANVETRRLLEAWQFAVQAAGTATEATVGKLVGDGEAALEDVKLVVEGTRLEREMWAKLDR